MFVPNNPVDVERFWPPTSVSWRTTRKFRGSEVSRIHLLVTMNVCTKCHDKSSHSCLWRFSALLDIPWPGWLAQEQLDFKIQSEASSVAINLALLAHSIVIENFSIDQSCWLEWLIFPREPTLLALLKMSVQDLTRSLCFLLFLSLSLNKLVSAFYIKPRPYYGPNAQHSCYTWPILKFVYNHHMTLWCCRHCVQRT